MKVRPYQRIANRIRKDILKGVYPLGEKLPAERKLANKFKVSRPLIREAIIALEIMGYVQVRENSGPYVVHPAKSNHEDLDVGAFELFEARVLIEGEIAALAAQLVSDEQIRELEGILREMQDGYASEDIERIEAADHEFHRLIAHVTNNGVLIANVAELWAARSRSPLAVRIISSLRESGHGRRIDEHNAILDALKRRDPAAARSAMREHIGKVLEEMFAASRLEAVEEARAKAQRDIEELEQLVSAEHDRYSLTLEESTTEQ